MGKLSRYRFQAAEDTGPSMGSAPPARRPSACASNSARVMSPTASGRGSGSGALAWGGGIGVWTCCTTGRAGMSAAGTGAACACA